MARAHPRHPCERTPLDLGFETIGNATLICHDRGPVLVTDPWLFGKPYFGSWSLSHTIPEEQLEAIRGARFVWLSHGHPDHLDPESLAQLKDKPILIGDHCGGRIAQGLREEGHEVRVLKTGEWTPLSERVRVLCVPDYSQDSVLLVDVDGTLLVDANDASDRGVGEFLRQTIASYERSFLMCLTGYGDADMIHFYDEAGDRIPPQAAKKEPVGPGIAEILRFYGIRRFVPFSSMHKYQRADTVWANEYRTPEDEHARDFDPAAGEIYPPFLHYDLAADTWRAIDPPEEPDRSIAPEEFGDDWSDELEPKEVEALRSYFQRVTHLPSFLGFVRFKVGGVEHTIDIAPERFDRGVTFETPRASLMTAIEYSVFDDLLIGNFTKTTLHGSWDAQGAEALYPHFTPFVTKYGDNGGAYTKDELKRYFQHYQASGCFGPGPSPATQLAWESIQPYLGA